MLVVAWSGNPLETTRTSRRATLPGYTCSRPRCYGPLRVALFQRGQQGPFAMLALFGVGLTAITAIVAFLQLTSARNPRINYEFTDAARIDRVNTMGAGNLTIQLDGRNVADPIYIYTSTIINTGSKDVPQDRFIDPIEISSGGKFDILSAKVDGPAGVNPEISLDRGGLLIKWKLLKPKEKITINAIVTTKCGGKEFENILQELRPNIRLLDVSLGYGVSRVYPYIFGTILTILIIGLMFLPLMYLTSDTSELVYKSSIDGELYGIGFNEDRYFRACKVQRTIFHTMQCHDLSDQRAINFLQSAKRMKVTVGSPLNDWAIIVPIAILYGILIFPIANAARRRWSIIYRSMRRLLSTG